jgi:hypothetical protein
MQEDENIFCLDMQEHSATRARRLGTTIEMSLEMQIKKSGTPVLNPYAQNDKPILQCSIKHRSSPVPKCQNNHQGKEES